MTIATAVEDHLAWLVSAAYAPDTIRTRRASLRSFVRWAETHGLHRPSDITPAVLEQYRAVAVLRRHGLPPPLAVGSQIQVLLAVKRFCAWCVRSGLAGADAAQNTTSVVAEEPVWGQGIAMLAAQLGHRGKASANFHTLDSVQPHHGIGDVGIEFVPMSDGQADAIIQEMFVPSNIWRHTPRLDRRSRLR